MDSNSGRPPPPILTKGRRKEDPAGCNATFCFASLRLFLQPIVRSLSWGHKSAEQRGAFWGFPPLGARLSTSRLTRCLKVFPRKTCVRLYHNNLDFTFRINLLQNEISSTSCVVVLTLRWRVCVVFKTGLIVHS